MRKAFLAAMALVTSMATFYTAAAGPAAAEPASSSSGSAYGLSATGAVAISPTITAAASQPPNSDSAVNELLSVPVGTLALDGTVGVAVLAHQADDITPQLVPPDVTTVAGLSRAITIAPANTVAVAKTDGLGVLFTAPATDPDPNRLAILKSLQVIGDTLGGLLTADAITSEAVAKCVDGKPVFGTGFKVAGIGGLLGALDPLVQTALNALLTLIGPGATLSSIISITPGVETPLADGVAVDGLRISVPLLNQNIVISHSEVHMAADCRVVVAPGPTGPGPVAATGGGGRLASTGTDLPFLPVGISLVALAMVGGGVVRRSRREKTATQ